MSLLLWKMKVAIKQRRDRSQYVKDTEKPELTGLHDLTVKVNGDVDYLSGLTAKDNRDPSPKITVDSSDVNLKKTGTYTVKYTVKDRSGNADTFTRNVKC